MERYYNSIDMDIGNDLEHHGVLGQKWGIRRYVNYDGTLTDEGKKKYGTYENFYKAYTQNKKGITSTTQLLQERKYEKQGMTTKEAQVKAIGKRQTEKTLMIAGGVTAAAIVGTMAARSAYAYNHDQSYDSMINVGDKKNSVNGLMYARGKNKGYDPDKPLYNYMLAGQRQIQSLFGITEKPGTQIENTFVKESGNKIKIASGKNGARIFNNLMKDASFRKDYQTAMLGHNATADMAEMMQLMNKPISGALSDASGRKEYNRFNKIIPVLIRDRNDGTLSGEATDRVFTRFTEALKKEGYSGVSDVNDTVGTGLPSRTASIVLDNTLKASGHTSLKPGNKYVGAGMHAALTLVPGLAVQGVFNNSQVKDFNARSNPILASRLLRASGYSHKQISSALKVKESDVKQYTAIIDRTLTSRAIRMRNSGASYAEIAKALGIPEEQVGGYLKKSK